MTTETKRILPYMGQQALVYAEMVREKSYDTVRRITWEEQKLKEPRVGWIVGVRWYREGKVINEGYEEGFLFHPKGKAFPLWLVSWWPTEKPVKVRPWDLVPLKKLEGAGEEVAAKPYPSRRAWVEEAREWAKTAKRDKKGRFV